MSAWRDRWYVARRKRLAAAAARKRDGDVHYLEGPVPLEDLANPRVALLFLLEAARQWGVVQAERIEVHDLVVEAGKVASAGLLRLDDPGPDDHSRGWSMSNCHFRLADGETLVDLAGTLIEMIQDAE